MTPLIILLIIFGAPIVILMFLRANAAIVFLGVCLGDVLLQFVGDQATSLASHQNIHANVTDSTVKLILLLLPPALTTIFMLRTVKKHRILFNLLPAVGTGLLVALLTVPLLPADLAMKIMELNVWHKAESYQGVIVGLSAAASLLFLWLQRPKSGGKEGKKSKKSVAAD